VTEPVKKQVAAVARPRTSAGRASAPAKAVKTATAVIERAVHDRTAAATAPPRVTRRATTSAPSAAAAAPTPQCVELPLLDLLPGGGQVKALLTMACDAAAALLLPSRSSVDQPAGGGRLDGLLGATSSVPARHGRRRSALLYVLRLGGASRRAGPITAQTATAASVFGATAAAPRAGGLPFIDAVNAHPAAAPVDSGSGRNAGGERHHHSFFAAQSSGTTVLMGILILNLAILAGIAMWRMAARWVLPRFV
jgi:hypothetical protein